MFSEHGASMDNQWMVVADGPLISCIPDQITTTITAEIMERNNETSMPYKMVQCIVISLFFLFVDVLHGRFCWPNWRLGHCFLWGFFETIYSILIFFWSENWFHYYRLILAVGDQSWSLFIWPQFFFLFFSITPSSLHLEHYVRECELWFFFVEKKPKKLLALFLTKWGVP